jgi:hypothetical protein
VLRELGRGAMGVVPAGTTLAAGGGERCCCPARRTAQPGRACPEAKAAAAGATGIITIDPSGAKATSIAMELLQGTGLKDRSRPGRCR